jgi:3-phenylpropionate/trans-cinnamate dioxygenase ferredoxin reductase component
VSSRIVIVGAGQAAAQAIDTLRRRGHSGPLALVGEEAWLPYQRPPLSKKYLAGSFEAARLLFRGEAYYAEREVGLHLGRRAVRIERAARRVHLDDGTTLEYDRLLLATGSSARRLPVPGAALQGVFVVRSRADVDAIRARLAAARHVAIIGGGYIGLEVAATCRELGLEVTVIEALERVMSRVVCPETSRFYEAEHARHGVRIVTGTQVRAIVGGGEARAVACADGTEHPADIVVIGVGVAACDALAIDAGLECANGIVVDDRCRTSDPVIYAAGDCTNHPSPHYGRRVRLESVDNAFEQGTTAALNMLGIDTSHDKVPWFWSDQYDLKLLMAGLTGDHDRMVMRGAPESRSFSVCYLRGTELVAIEALNAPKDHMAARKLIAARTPLDLARLADARVPLKDCAL